MRMMVMMRMRMMTMRMTMMIMMMMMMMMIMMMMIAPLAGGKTHTDQKGLSGSDNPPPVPSRTNHITENLLRDNQVPEDSSLSQTSRSFI